MGGKRGWSIEGEWGRNGMMRMWISRGHRKGNQ